jgi:hypothetical protein
MLHGFDAVKSLDFTRARSQEGDPLCSPLRRHERIRDPGTDQRGRSAPVLPDQAATRSVTEAADEALPRTMIPAINLP